MEIGRLIYVDHKKGFGPVQDGISFIRRQRFGSLWMDVFINLTPGGYATEVSGVADGRDVAIAARARYCLGWQLIRYDGLYDIIGGW